MINHDSPFKFFLSGPFSGAVSGAVTAGPLLTGVLLTGVLLLAACSPLEESDNQASPDQASAEDRKSFITTLRTLCGRSFTGKLVSTDEIDATFRTLPMVMHVRDCEETVIRIPFHVGDNHSRTWVISYSDEAIKLQHDHRHEDGTPDVVTLYGGSTIQGPDPLNINTATVQHFPADAYTKELFIREGIEVSTQNIWQIEVKPDYQFSYQLSRPNRLFRVEFDLTNPVETPPPAWGYRD